MSDSESSPLKVGRPKQAEFHFINNLTSGCIECHSRTYDPKFLSSDAPFIQQILEHKEDILRVLQDGSMPPPDSKPHVKFTDQHRRSVLDMLKKIK